ncbi:acyl-CoA dehydratase activase, partial [Aduncisulcus paluster]
MVLTGNDHGRIEILKSISLNHEGNPAQTVITALQDLDLPENIPAAVTGRKFRHLLDLPTISEPQALETALTHQNFVKDGY